MRDIKIGLTLLETLIVVAIIVILAAISVPSLMQTQHSAGRGVIVTDLQALTDALSAHFMLCEFALAGAASLGVFPFCKGCGTSRSGRFFVD